MWKNLHCKWIISAWIFKSRPICIHTTQRERSFHSRLPFWTQRSEKKLIHFNLSRSGRHTKSSSFESRINWQFLSEGSDTALKYWTDQFDIPLMKFYSASALSQSQRRQRCPAQELSIKWSAETGAAPFIPLDWSEVICQDARLRLSCGHWGMSSAIIIYYHLQSHWEIKTARYSNASNIEASDGARSSR